MRIARVLHPLFIIVPDTVDALYGAYGNDHLITTFTSSFVVLTYVKATRFLSLKPERAMTGFFWTASLALSP